jgi:PP-loop superfamily ATP-utilizing enzyme
MKKSLPISELAWTLADYEIAGEEAPERIIDNPELTEGEMMSVEEIEEFIKDSVATLRVLAEQHSARHERIADQFRADLAYLLKVGSIMQEEFDGLVDETNLRF